MPVEILTLSQRAEWERFPEERRRPARPAPQRRAGWWWADPAAGLVIVYYGIREGRHALRTPH